MSLIHSPLHITNKVQRKYEITPSKPMYFKYINLVAYHAFLSMKVDTTILEVGLGGEYDSTNIVPKPIVTGVTALGLDHTAILGKTLKEIAWQKAGIFKVRPSGLSGSEHHPNAECWL